MYEPLCCERVETKLGDYLEGCLTKPLHLRVQSHLIVCVDCWRDVQKLRRTITCLSDLPRRPMPPAIRSAILRAGRALLAHP